MVAFSKILGTVALSLALAAPSTVVQAQMLTPDHNNAVPAETATGKPDISPQAADVEQAWKPRGIEGRMFARTVGCKPTDCAKKCDKKQSDVYKSWAAKCKGNEWMPTCWIEPNDMDACGCEPCS